MQLSLVNGTLQNEAIFFDNQQVYDVRRSGVVPGEGIDNTEALRNALTQAAALGLPVKLPEGVIEYSPATVNDMLITTTSIIGSGKSTVLRCTNENGNRSLILINGSNITISNFSFESSFLTGNRPENNTAFKVEPPVGSETVWENIEFSNLWFKNFSGGNILLKHVAKSRVYNIYSHTSGADIVHVTGNSKDITVDSVYSVMAGDDTVAVIGYTAGNVQGQPQNIKISNVTVVDSWHGRGVTVVGGKNVQITDVLVDGCDGAGILISSEAGTYNTFGNSNILISNATLIRAGKGGASGALHVLGRAGYITENIQIQNVKIISSNWRGLSLSGTIYAKNISVENLEVDGTPSSQGILINSTNTRLKNITVANTAGIGIAYEPAVSGYLEIDGLYGRNVNLASESGTGLLLNIANNASSPLTRLSLDNMHLVEQSVGAARETFQIPSNLAPKTKFGSNLTTVVPGPTDLGYESFNLGLPFYNINLTTITTSPWIYQNTSGYEQWVYLRAGTLSDIEISHNGTDFYSVGSAKRNIALKNGYSIRVTFSVKPTEIKIKPVSLI